VSVSLIGGKRWPLQAAEEMAAEQAEAAAAAARAAEETAARYERPTKRGKSYEKKWARSIIAHAPRQGGNDAGAAGAGAGGCGGRGGGGRE
jgi:hypothetical protein